MSPTLARLQAGVASPGSDAGVLHLSGGERPPPRLRRVLPRLRGSTARGESPPSPGFAGYSPTARGRVFWSPLGSVWQHLGLAQVLLQDSPSPGPRQGSHRVGDAAPAPPARHITG